MVVASSLGGRADDDPPDDPWARGARPDRGHLSQDDEQGQQRLRRAWRRSDIGESPDGADGATPAAGNHEPDDGVPQSGTRTVPDHGAWENWNGPSHAQHEGWNWSQWNYGWEWKDWSQDNWTSRTSSTAGAEPGPATQATAPYSGWTRTTSASTTRRNSLDGGNGEWRWSSTTSPETGYEGDRERRGGVSEKMSVPGFSAEDQGEKLGASARSYIRQIDAWTQVTRAPRTQQALLLYQALSGRAWIEAEELQVSELATEDGVEKYKAWIMERYQEIEVGKIAEALNGFFKRLRRSQGQSIREFNASFDRAYARLIEVDCRLPETAKAWAYLNALALNHTEELTVLGSVAKEYVTSKLQRAAVLHEKSLKRPWDKDRPRPWERDAGAPRTFGKANSAMNTDHADEEPPWAGSSEDFEVAEDEEARVFEAYMTAKHQYRDILRSRGLDQEGVKKATEDRIALAKSKSFCSVCKQKGHWHRDAECPARKGVSGHADNDKPAGKIQTAHAIFETNTHAGESLLAITDCACTKSVMGTSWLQRYVDVLRSMNIEVPLLPEQDNFRFGTSRIFASSYAVVVPFRLGSSWVLLRASVVHGDLPLLVSRSALAALGMVYDLDNHVADFSTVQVSGHPLLTTPSGHPALNVHPGNQGLPPHVHPKMWDAKKSIRGDIQIVAHQEAYMVGTTGLGIGDRLLGSNHRVPQLFYEKKVTPEVRNMLSGDSLDLESFVRWWQLTKITADFWIETPEALIRVHVVPRKSFFNPIADHFVTFLL
ncbi:hypothetical protein AK812_SmicGene11376 [Symbiodinium microadriaticum]|uniref:Uncharacterized protein n=1 Tax=Symbiodinium microadriaticum TaxID=2951 RepID=A0A1Q9EDG7_SYMMI|nr:hypothetical protein AK812_SmicGene11376 [Symbiodinium microadriaticum]